MATFLARGQDIVSNPNVNALSGAGTDNAGQITVSGGSQPFADDMIVQFTTQNETADGELDGNSGFIGIEVYADQAAYDAGTPLYSYDPQNPGQSANVQDSVDGIGDEYIRFNANVLVSSDAGAPSLSSLFVAPNSGIANAGASTVFNHNTDLDLNNDGTIDTATIENGNGLFNLASGFSAVSAPAVCFTSGMKIKTKNGYELIDDLKIGDEICVYEGDFAKIKFIYKRKVRALGHHRPVRFEAAAIGNDKPVIVSQQHRFLVSTLPLELKIRKKLHGYGNHLIQAVHLVDHGLITIDHSQEYVEYFHLMLDKHELIYCNGTVSESWQPHRRNLRRNKALRAELLSIFPEIAQKGPQTGGGAIYPEIAPIALSINKS